MNPDVTTIAMGDHAFLECPRWHNDELWVSDMHLNRVSTMSEAGQIRQTIDIPDRPAGLGWLPDGDLLAVSSKQRKIYRYDGSTLQVHADLSAIGAIEHEINDMVVDASGRCFVGEYGFDIHPWIAEYGPRALVEGPQLLGGLPLPPASVFCVEPSGEVKIAASDLRFPNGSAITPDGRYLIVAESYGLRLSRFELQEGQLASRTTIELGFTPDGISRFDEEGALWVASPRDKAVHRVDASGAKLDTIQFELPVYACELGGADGQTLFVCISSISDPNVTVVQRDSRVCALSVPVPVASTDVVSK